MDFIKTYVSSFIVFLLIDLVWLGIAAKKLYNRYLGYLLSPSPKLDGSHPVLSGFCRRHRLLCRHPGSGKA